MYYSPAAFPADSNEPFNNSSPIWSSYDPHVTPPSGVYVNNYWNEYHYAPVYYEQQNFAAYYQPVYFNNVVYYGFYVYPVTTYFVPVFYYPVPATAAFVDTPDVPSEYDDEHDISNVNDIGYEILENRDVCPYAGQATPSDAVTSFEIYHVEEGEQLNDAPCHSDDDDSKKEGDKKDYDDKKNYDDNRNSSLGNKMPMNQNNVKESPNYRKFFSDVEERRKILGASSQAKRTFVNRGIVKDSSAYNNFCRSVEDKIKKKSSSPPGDRDHEKESPNYIKFCSEVEDRRKILDSSSVRQKTYINRGIVADVSSYRKFCRTVEDRIKKQGSVETSPSCGINKFIDKESSKGDGVAHEEKGLKFIDVILNSSEYLHVKDNIENPKYYRDLLYRQSLKKNPRRNNTVLFDILPSIFEEPLILDDVTAEISRGDPTVIGPGELVSKDEITKPKQRKGRWKRFRNWWSKTFCCGYKTKDPS